MFDQYFACSYHWFKISLTYPPTQWECVQAFDDQPGAIEHRRMAKEQGNRQMGELRQFNDIFGLEEGEEADAELGGVVADKVVEIWNKQIKNRSMLISPTTLSSLIFLKKAFAKFTQSIFDDSTIQKIM